MLTTIPATAPVPVPMATINLVGTVTQMLVAMGHPHPTAWENELALRWPHVMTPGDPELQRRAINQYWRVQIGMITNASNVDARYCLDDQSDLATWLRHFRDGVAPFVTRHRLPNIY